MHSKVPTKTPYPEYVESDVPPASIIPYML